MQEALFFATGSICPLFLFKTPDSPAICAAFRLQQQLNIAQKLLAVHFGQHMQHSRGPDEVNLTHQVPCSNHTRSVCQSAWCAACVGDDLRHARLQVTMLLYVIEGIRAKGQ